MVPEIEYQEAVRNFVQLLIEKRYPEDEMILDDDVIVLTKVDIGSSIDSSDNIESDSDDDEFPEEDNDYDLQDDSSDLDDFIDDRPESELSEESDVSENDSGDDEVQDREYNSESENDDGENDGGNDNDSEDDGQNEGESGQENYGGNDNDSENDDERENENKSDSDDDIKVSPSKKAKIDFLAESSSDENSNDGHEDDHSSQEGPSLLTASMMNDFFLLNHQPKQVNKFNVFLLPKIHGHRTIIRYHGRIGMQGIKGFCRRMRTKKSFCNLIRKKRQNEGFTRMNLMYVNARHLEYRKEDSELPRAVRKLLIHLIDQWFPLGIPQQIHLNRATDLLLYIKRRLMKGKIPHLKYSNKFYELIPHQGDNRRRKRFTDIDFCDNKSEFVEKMKSAVECLSRCTRSKNPLDYFIENWLRIELSVLNPEENAFQILNKVVENTQHSYRKFHTKHIFKVDNMNPDLNGDFSTMITTNHRYLLHFSFATNLPCILREGLQPAPEHIHSVNRFLGKGIYFWDAVANAGLNYRSLNTVYILVCRVALGRTKELDQPYLKEGETLELDKNVDSILCLGKKFSSSRDGKLWEVVRIQRRCISS